MSFSVGASSSPNLYDTQENLSPNILDMLDSSQVNPHLSVTNSVGDKRTRDNSEYQETDYILGQEYEQAHNVPSESQDPSEPSSSRKPNHYFVFAPFNAPGDVGSFLKNDISKLKQPYDVQLNNSWPNGVHFHGNCNTRDLNGASYSLFTQVLENKRVTVNLSTLQDRQISILILALDFQPPTGTERTFIDPLFNSSIYVYCPVAIFDAKTLSAVCLYIPEVHFPAALGCMQTVADSFRTNLNGMAI